jgi:hypothetical protein
MSEGGGGGGGGGNGGLQDASKYEIQFNIM